MASSDEGTRGRSADTAEQRRSTLRRIEAALERLEAGQYGWCMVCGEQIAAARLVREPATACCLACSRLSPSADR